MTSIAVFVTPHGFGHATRTCAILEALVARRPDLRLELFTQVPRWLFTDSLTTDFGYHPLGCDVGLVQTSALLEDASATVEALGRFLAESPGLLEALESQLESLGCRGVLCDVSGLGLELARRLALPSVLVENFVWSWVYQAYLAEAPGLEPGIEILRGWEDSATLRIGAQPHCGEAQRVMVGPIYRRAREGRLATRSRLGIEPNASMVLVTMGGIPWDFGDLGSLALPSGVVLVVPGGAERAERSGEVLLLPRHSDFYHPDLMTAADGVVGKLGYSTVAEAWGSGTPLGYIPRERFPESPFLERFVENEDAGFAIAARDLEGPGLVTTVERLLEGPTLSTSREGGAVTAAGRILETLLL